MSSFEPNPIRESAEAFEALGLELASGFGRETESAEAIQARQEREAAAEREALLSQGRAEGRAAAAAENAEAWAKGLSELATLRRDYLVRNREATIELALAIAGNILRRELADHREVLLSLIEHATATAQVEGPLTVRVSAEDLPSLQEALRAAGAADTAGGASASTPLASEFTLEADGELAAGDFRVEGLETEIDGRVDALLDIARASLLPMAGVEAEPGSAANESASAGHPDPSSGADGAPPVDEEPSGGGAA